MKKILRGTYAKITVETVEVDGNDALEVTVEDYGGYVFNIKQEDLNELIETLQEAKEVLSRGRDTDE